jgi:hypothetical protein
MPAMQMRVEPLLARGSAIPAAASKGSFEVAEDSQKQRRADAEN